MKKNLVFGILIIVLVLAKFVFASSLESIKPVDAKKMVDEKKALLIDVREADEIKAGKAKDAIVLSKSLMDNNKVAWTAEVDKLPKDKTIVVYCASGRRAGIVGEELVKKGFKVLNMGGYEPWKSAGLPVE